MEPLNRFGYAPRPMGKSSTQSPAPEAQAGPPPALAASGSAAKAPPEEAAPAAASAASVSSAMRRIEAEDEGQETSTKEEVLPLYRQILAIRRMEEAASSKVENLRTLRKAAS